MIGDGEIDMVILNCVLNLVRFEDCYKFFVEIFCVLCEGGLVVISDIVSDEDVFEYFCNNLLLWLGCIFGVFCED